MEYSIGRGLSDEDIGKLILKAIDLSSGDVYISEEHDGSSCVDGWIHFTQVATKLRELLKDIK